MRVSGQFRTVIYHLSAGAVIGLLGVFLFGVVHALAIVPIWRRLFGGIPFAVSAGLAMAWALYELRSSRTSLSGALAGMRFGFLMWITMLPMTLFTVVMRTTGLHRTEGNLEIVMACVLSAASGMLVGWMLAWRLRAAIATGVASLALALAQAGPIPVSNSSRATYLFAGLAIVYPLCGTVLGWRASTIPARPLAQSPADDAGRSPAEST